MTEARRADDRPKIGRRDHPGRTAAHTRTPGGVPAACTAPGLARPVCLGAVPHRLRGRARGGVLSPVPAIRQLPTGAVPAGLSAADAAFPARLDRRAGAEPGTRGPAPVR